MFWKVPEASAHDSDTKSLRKPRTYASSREFWKLLENAGTWAGAAGVDQKLLEYMSQPTRQQHSNSCLSGRLAYEGAGLSLRLRKLCTAWSRGLGKGSGMFKKLAVQDPEPREA